MTDSIQLANEALQLFLHSLPVGSYFNIVSYGSNYDAMWSSSVEYNQENLKIATDKVNQFKADFGGTDIFTPIDDICTA